MRTQYIPSQWRQKILSDESVKFFWSEEDNLEHYKTCLEARTIPDNKLHFSNIYNPSMKQCPSCACRCYIDAYAKDPAEYKKYENDYKEMGITHNALRKMYINCAITTKRNSDGIILFHNGEQWKIKKGSSKKGHIRLYHNNYTIKDGEKIIYPGQYHEQIKTKNLQNIDNILKHIIDYDYSQHCINRKERPVKKELLYIQPSASNSILGRFYIWIGKKLNWINKSYQ